MIKLIENLPSGTIGFEANGEITANDYETVIFPAVEKALKENRKVRMLYHIGAGFKKFEMGAMWDDGKVGLKHLSAWEKIALVTDIEWIRLSVKAMAFIMPGRLKLFSNNEMEQAIQWLSR